MQQLAEYITNHLEKPFQWGVNDCCIFTVGWIENATGREYLTQYLPWKTKKEAHKVIKAIGGLEKVFGENLKEINPHFATDGDVTILNNTAFIFSGSHIVSVGESGLIFLDRMEAVRAWKVS